MVPPTEGILPALSSALFLIALLGLPTAIGIAVLRYRLYEIDRILSRTATYGLVTAVLAGIYALVAVVPTVIFDLQSDSFGGRAHVGGRCGLRTGPSEDASAGRSAFQSPALRRRSCG